MTIEFGNLLIIAIKNDASTITDPSSIIVASIIVSIPKLRSFPVIINFESFASNSNPANIGKDVLLEIAFEEIFKASNKDNLLILKFMWKTSLYFYEYSI